MIDRPTLFILGAGASKPYGYLTGAELRADIIKNFSNYFQKLENITPAASRDIKKFVDTFSKSSLISIDRYLSLNPATAQGGKMGITLSILNSEKNSSFREDIEDPNEDWYTYLFNRMMDGLNKRDDYKKFSENKVAFITFNYDKSLEYILYESFYHSFYQNRQDIEKNIENLISFPIIHVYGTVDEFKTLEWPGHNYRKDFKDFFSIENLSKGIMVIGEERAGESIKEQIKKLLPNYKRIFFLGFGYAKENLDAIDFAKNVSHKTFVYGTAKGMTKKEIKDISGYFPIIPGETYYIQETEESIDTTFRPTIKDINCLELLREYL
jgi:hypothetical protein